MKKEENLSKRRKIAVAALQVIPGIVCFAVCLMYSFQ